MQYSNLFFMISTHNDKAKHITLLFWKEPFQVSQELYSLESFYEHERVVYTHDPQSHKGKPKKLQIELNK